MLSVSVVIHSCPHRAMELNILKEQRIKDMARRTHPSTNADFAVLYNELDNWRKTEIAKIKVCMSANYVSVHVVLL